MRQHHYQRGTVIAIGHSGTTAENEGAVGIGSGSYYSNCEGITISGGTVTATGSQYGAGIGSGSYESDCGYITISGGTVTATGGEKGAGIGDSSNNSFCVDMTISGGTVTAIGGWGAAGIGSGYSYTECWSITISGGTVTATGGQYAPGIGSGYYNSSCGEITITNGVTLVTATKGGSCNNTIGAGNFQSNCGPVTIGDLGTGFIKQSPFVTFPYTVRFNPNSGTGTMDDQGFMYNVAQKLTANSFTLLGSEFEGWATTANGEKEYDNNEKVTNLADTIAIVTLYAKWIPDLSMNGDVYTIYTATGWDLFCNLLADNNYNNFAGKTVNLANDITVTTMAGVWNSYSDNHTFKGTFDGQGHTLTLNYSSTEDHCAPFRYINGATFQNLRIAGNINTSGQYGGVVGHAFGTNSFTNCRSSMTINGTRNGTGAHGGFVGLISQGTTTFTGCAFDGTFSSTVTTNWGGFVGFVEGGAHATFRYCLFAPANSTFGFSTDGSQTFARLYNNDSGLATFSNNFVSNYTTALGGTQGKHVYSITGDQFVTVAFSGSATTHYNVNDIHVYSYGKVYNNTPYASKETTVGLNLGCTPPSGSTCVGYQASAGTLTGSENPYTLAMPAANVTIQPIWSIALEGTGTSTDPYLISSVADWDLFAQVVTEGITLANQFVQLNADITVTSMAGSWNSDSDYRAFSGTFLGNEHTLTLNYSSNETHCAPFRVIDGATIQNLHLAGTINAGDQFSAMVGHAYGDCNFTNCRSSITIISSRSGYGTHGGFVGRVRTGTSNFVGCVFDGFFSGPNTHAWGGFVGHVESTSLANFTDCLFAPANSSFDFDIYDSQTFARLRNDNPIYATFTNCYYTQILGGAQGIQAYTITPDEYVTVAFSGQATDYTMSGISAYSAGMVYDSILYAGNGDTVSLSLGCTPPSGFACIGYEASAGTLTGTANPFTLTMPDENVTIQASLLQGTGSSDDPYLIQSAGDWDTFAQSVTNGTTYAGQYVRLAADISVTTMAGSRNSDSDYHAFSGTFDGDGHTLTLDYSTTLSDGAPFRVVNGATLHDLHIAGTIQTSGQFNGVVGHAYSTCNFTNCRSTLTINSTRDGDGTHGGFVGVISSGTTTFTGCVFDGTFTSTNTTRWGGFVGFVEGNNQAHANFTDCLFAPANSSFGFNTNESQTFARLRNNNSSFATFSNSYYTKTLGGAQGIRAYSITGDEFVAVAFSGQATATYSVSGIGVFNPGIVCDSTLYASNGATVSLDLGGNPGYLCSDFVASAGTLTGTTNPYTLVMPAENVLITATWAPDPTHFGETDTDEYTIHTASGWDVFCNLLAENSNGYFTGKTVKLGVDISVTRMAGSSGHEFSGTFDGQGHTLTVSYQNNDGNVRTAPFTYVDGATIQNLIVAGSITGTAYRAAGIVGETVGSLSHVTNCVSSVNVSGGNYTGGISVGGKVEITGCVFNGTIVGTDKSGGFVGWSTSALVISDCLFAPQEGSTISGGTFYYNGGGEITPVNSYYTMPLGTPQGKQAHSITGDADGAVTVAFNGQATAYDISGISAYSVGMVYDSTLYAGEGDTLGLNLGCTPPSGYFCSGYQASAGILTGTTNPYTLVMPNMSVTLYAVIEELPSSVDYIDSAGEMHTCSNFTVLTGNETTLEAGWYVVYNNITYNSTLTLNGDVTLILCDGKTMTVAPASGEGIYGFQKSLTIYGQSLDSIVAGTLNVSNNDWMFAAISPSTYIQHSGNVVVSNNSNGNTLAAANIIINGGSINANGGLFGIFADETLTINGGSINANGGSINANGGFGISTNYLTVNGGSIHANGGDRGINASNLTINGGTVIANCYVNQEEDAGLSITCNLLINGGKVDVSSIYSEGDITLGWTNTDDYIHANSYHANGTLSVKSGQAFYYEEYGVNVIVSGTLDEDQIQAIGGKTLRPRGVDYIDGDGEMHICTDYTVLTGNETTLEAGWYAVDHDITYDHTLSLNGNVTLILCNGKTMTVTPESGRGIDGLQKSLTIYGQSLDSIVAGTLNVIGDGSYTAIELSLGTYTQHSGNVVASNSNADALNADTLTINGGSINANGGNIFATGMTINGGSIHANGGYYGIIAGDLTINGGSIHANGELGGIYANGAMTINGGSIHANGDYYGIFAGDLTINGGTVIANSNDATRTGLSITGNLLINGGKVEASSIRASQNITLGWTHTDDYIYAGSYNVPNGTVSVKSGQAFYCEEDEDIIVSGTLDGGQIAAIGGKTLRPYIVPVTFTKDIAGYGTGDGGYYLIALPMYGTIDPATIGNMVADSTTHYDLYRFEPSHEGNEWENYKADSTFVLEAGKGYLYANKNNVTLTFSGPAYYGDSCEIALVYDSTDYQKCWNLVGNPFNCNATLDRPYYVLSAGGTGINPEPIPANTPIPPCTAVFVKAVAVGDKAVFTKVTQ